MVRLRLRHNHGQHLKWFWRIRWIYLEKHMLEMGNRQFYCLFSPFFGWVQRSFCPCLRPVRGTDLKAVFTLQWVWLVRYKRSSSILKWGEFLIYNDFKVKPKDVNEITSEEQNLTCDIKKVTTFRKSRNASSLGKLILLISRKQTSSLVS